MKLLLWWLSFAEPGGNLGVCIVEAPSPEEALRVAWRLGCNPGGSAMAMRLPDDQRSAFAPHMNQLIPKERAAELFGPLSRPPPRRDLN